MSAQAIQSKAPASSAPVVTAREIDQVDRALIDASARGPVLFFFTTAITWLLASTVFGLIASIKLHSPEFLSQWEWLTYGRVWPAYMDMFAYGWACPAAMGVAIWLLARLCRVSLKRPALLVFGGVFWNIGVTIGVVGILIGANQGLEFLEFPGAAAAVCFIGYSLVGVWAAVAFDARRPGHTFISVWYLVGAIFWFPWMFGATYLLLTGLHIQGVMQVALGAWFAGNFLGLWFTAIGLAAIYYLIPKVIGKPIHSYHLASIGFWTFAIFQAWTGMVRYTGGPFPVWMPTVSIAATILLLIPVATVTVNYVMTMRGHYNMVYHSPTIRFTVFGALAYTLWNLLSLLGAFRSVDRFTHFTQFGIGLNHLGLYAFFTMVMFGAIYYITPRLVGCEWLSSTMIRLHFWGSAYGIGAVVLMLVIGGIAQGMAMVNLDPAIDPHLQFLQAVQTVVPFLRGRTLAWMLLVAAHIIFSLHFLLMLLRFGRPAGEPTLFAPMDEEVKPH